MSCSVDSKLSESSQARSACCSVSQRSNKKCEKQSTSSCVPHTLFSSDSDALVEGGRCICPEVIDTFKSSHLKPQVITGALFMWQQVASFSEPRQVCEIERLCKDIAAHLQISNTSNRLMQRYWNARWTGMVWGDNALSHEKRFILPFSLCRSKGRINWKKRYVEEYPLWLERTIMRKSNNDSAHDASKVLFRRELLNVRQSGEELAAMELSLEETIRKSMDKRGIVIKANESSSSMDLESEAQKYTKGLVKQRGGKVDRGGQGASSRLLSKGHISVNLHPQPSSQELSREAYHMDSRLGSRKGKHKKGLDKKWTSYDSFGDYDY